MDFAKPETRKEFDQTTANGVCLVDFTAPWCGPCRAQEPIIRQVAKDFEGRVRIVAVDVSENREVAAQMNIYSIPTLVVYKNGREVERFVGAQPLQVLAGAIERADKTGE